MTTNLYTSIKTFEDAYNYLLTDNFRKDDYVKDLLVSYFSCLSGSYEEKLVKLRMIVTSLTNNETFSFSKKVLYPRLVLTTYYSISEDNLIERVLFNNNKEFFAYCFISTSEYSIKENSGFYYLAFSVSDKPILEHFIRYFGKLLCEVVFSGYYTWKWIE